MYKKFMTITVVLCMMCRIMHLNIHAEEQSSSTTISYTVDEHYEWQVPKKIDLGDTETMTVQALNTVIGSKSTLNIRVMSKNGFVLCEESNRYSGIPYTLRLSDSTVLKNGDTVLSVPSGTENSKAILKAVIESRNNIHASKYSDLLVFNASVEKVEATE